MKKSNYLVSKRFKKFPKLSIPCPSSATMPPAIERMARSFLRPGPWAPGKQIAPENAESLLSFAFFASKRVAETDYDKLGSSKKPWNPISDFSGVLLSSTSVIQGRPRRTPTGRVTTSEVQPWKPTQKPLWEDIGIHTGIYINIFSYIYIYIHCVSHTMSL